VAACLSTVFAVHEAPAAIGLLALAAAGFLRERQTTRTPNPRHQTGRDVTRQTNSNTTTETS
jgi:MYXO-CTERM domain-containing protein